MPVAKSYTQYEIIGVPFYQSGRPYVNINYKGTNKVVRWYSDEEYEKMYAPKAKVTKTAVVKENPARKFLGFGDGGYITIFRGDQFEHNEWFKKSVARYHRVWGWYIISTDEVPNDLPEEITPIKLEWDKITHVNGDLRSDAEIKEYVDKLVYGESDSTFVGSIGERLDLKLTVKRAHTFDGAYGSSTLHVFEDELGNLFVWTTSSRTLPPGKTYMVRGSVKAHEIYRGACQTILTRCKIVKELD